MSVFKSGFLLTVLSLFIFCAPAGHAAEKQDDLSDLAKKTQNPLEKMISVPFQYNAYLNTGPDKQLEHVLNIQPVIPFSLNEDLNLITRTIIPLIDTPWPEKQSGMGDIQFSAFLSSARSEKFLWGLGPIVQLPSATQRILGTEKWAAGPTAVGVYMDGPWVAGVLFNHKWSFAGNDSRPEVNNTLIQPFINYNLPRGWSIGTSPMITADWTAKESDRWTIPLGLSLSKTVVIGVPVSLSCSAYYNVERPELASDWNLRAVVTFMFPD